MDTVPLAPVQAVGADLLADKPGRGWSLPQCLAEAGMVTRLDYAS